MNDNDVQFQEEEECIFFGAQILEGNLDQKLDKRGEDLGERRGRGVLDAFDWKNELDTQIKKDLDVDVKKFIKEAQKCIVGRALLPTPEGGSKMPLWRILRLPILSTAHVGIANSLVSKAISNDNDNELFNEARKYLSLSLESWACNPSALLALANLTRMGFAVAKLDYSTRAERQRMIHAMELYQVAASTGSAVREFALNKLNGSDLSQDELFLIASIVLSLGSQVEELDDEEDNGDIKAKSHTEIDYHYGPSKVVSTASYMAAMLASTLGYHDMAEQSLEPFGGDMTRIHPNVWDTALNLSSNPKDDADKSSQTSSSGAFTPCIFREAIPRDVARVLKYAFRHDASYYKQSGYDRGVYYSFWSDYRKPNKNDKEIVVANAIEHVILKYLLPRVKAVCGEDALAKLAGFEWWVHTRPHGSNLGHQLHFDTDEALLEQDQIVSFPICATVLYLSEHENESDANDDNFNQKFGATVLFDQTPYSKENANKAWLVDPKFRSFLVFPGDLLHGVLPCAPSSNSEYEAKTSKRQKISFEDKADNNTLTERRHRLTFMVNFWARSIPTKLKKRKLYGPSGPFPPQTRSHSWTNDLLAQGTYPRRMKIACNGPLKEDGGVKTERLRCVQPAWEKLIEKNKNKDGNEDNASVPLPPSGINQRFFVKNAPDFFHSTLFEK